MLIYALCQNSQGKSALYFIRFISTEKWVGCKHFKSYIFEVFPDKHGQVGGDSMTRSRLSPLIVFLRQNHITFIFIKTMSHDLSVQMAYCYYYSLIGIQSISWEFFNGEQITLQKPKIDLFDIVL